MYHVISTGVTAIILYLISYFFAKTGFYSINDHRKVWNIVLAFTFLITLSAGLLLALQITYKWNISFIKSVLKWHVECGISLSFTGIFHFIWHLSYFNSIFRTSRNVETGIESPPATKNQSIINLVVIGFTSTAVQLLLIREIMNLAGGYELIAGTFLSSWLIGSAAGSFMAKKSTLNDIRKINFLFAFATPITIFLLILLQRIFLNPGETPSYFISVIMTLISLFPFCFVSGFTFVKLINNAKKSVGQQAGKSFSFETAGSIAAGILVSILMAGLLNTYQLLILIILLNITYVLITFYIRSRNGKLIVSFITAILYVATLFFNPDILFRQLILQKIKVKDTRDTPYGNITIGEYGGEKSIYYNQRLQSYQNDEIEREENIHYAILQHDDPVNVLLISGDIKSNLREVLKYNINKVIFIERDPALLSNELADNDTLSGKLTVINDDPFKYIKHTHDNFDVVLLFLPPPSTLLINRFYTTEFFGEVKKKMGNNGIFMCSPGSGDNYYSKESVVLYSSVYNSLKAIFKNVKPIVGNKLYFLSSDAELTTSICSLVEKKGIRNTYVNSDYLSDDMIKKRSNDVMNLIDPGIRQNTFGFPVACFHYQSYNLSKNLNEKIPSIIVLVLIFIVPVFSIRRRNLIMFSAAAALAGFEIIALLVLQTAVGNMYLLTGLVIASLMTGLAIGSYFNFRRSDLTVIRFIGLILIVFYICTGLIFNNIQFAGNYLSSIILILAFIFVPSILTGQLFNVITSRNERFSDPSSVYSADLTGSALGFIFISGFVVPAAGISMTIILLSALIFAALLFGTIDYK
jgi:spermidine synthase